MAFEVGHSGDEVVVRAHGPLHGSTTALLDSILAELAEEDRSRVVVDLARVTSIDEGGVATLVRGYRRLRATGADLRLRDPSSRAEAVLRCAGLLPSLLAS